MTEGKNYLSQNIKSLRKAFGESQMDLAFAIGLKGPTTISNYESGRRSPDREMIKRIAEHYRITEEELLYVDQSKMRQVPQMALVALFPSVRSEAAMKNEVFVNGYNADMRMRKCIRSGQEPDVRDLEICFDSYERAFDEASIPEAAGNELWWLLQTEYALLNPKVSEGSQKLIKNKISVEEFLRNYYLNNFDFEDEDETEDNFDSKEAMEIYADIKKRVQYLLRKLRSSRLSNLAYYYLAIRYALGNVKNGRSQEMNQAIGNEMLVAFSELGNKYAKKYEKYFYM